MIGRLAVLARVAGAYRVTNDVDTVSEPHALAVVLARRGQRVGSGWTVDGVAVDLIEVGTTPAADIPSAELPDEEADRVFVLSHQWALDTATPLEIVACDDRGRAIAEAACRVATPAALVAMKIQSAPRRSAARRYKSASDYSDIYWLLTRPGLLNPTAAALAAAPHGLGEWVAAELERRFVANAERVAGIVRAGIGVGPGHSITPDDLREAGMRGVTALRQKPGGAL